MTILSIQILNSLFYASVLFLIAAGLSLIFGVMRIVNMAHGSFYLLGGYIAYEVQQKMTGSGYTIAGTDVIIEGGPTKADFQTERAFGTSVVATAISAVAFLLAGAAVAAALGLVAAVAIRSDRSSSNDRRWSRSTRIRARLTSSRRMSCAANSSGRRSMPSRRRSAA